MLSRMMRALACEQVRDYFVVCEATEAIEA